MAYFTDTEVKTQVRRDDRFGGFNRTDTRQSTLFEPEFKPFSYGTEEIVASTDQIVASTDEIVADGTDEIVASEPQFEVEKQYHFNTQRYNQSREYDETREMDMPTFERDSAVQYKNQVQTYRKVKLNARGKIAITVYSIVVAIIVAFCIYNGVMINSVNSQILGKSEIVATQTQVITDLENTYNSLGKDDYIISQVGDSFKVPTVADTVSVSDFKMTERAERPEETNWFEDFCEALRKLFN